MKIRHAHISGAASHSRRFPLGRPAFNVVLFLLILCCSSHHAWGVPVAPFHTQNQAPLNMIFGLPVTGEAGVLDQGSISTMLVTEVSNNWAIDSKGDEKMTLDGESYRVDLVFRYGLGKGFEAGMDIPYIGIGGGTFDHFIENFHDVTGLPNANREDSPRDKLFYSYTNGGETKLLHNDSGSGLGDIRLSGGMQLYNDNRPNPRQLALRAELKLPTGSSKNLRGSGSTDFALWLTASDDYRLPAWGHLTLFGSAGGMAMTDGDIIEDQQRNLAAFGSLGLGWAPADWIDFKAQFMANSTLFKGEVRQLSQPGLLVLLGGSLHFWNTSVDIGVGEDVIVKTSPDVTFHLALRRNF